MKLLTPNERARLRARSGCAEETIKAYPHVREASALRIRSAAEAEGIELPRLLSDSTPPARTG